MAEFTFYNQNGELTLSADGLTYGYIGRASLQSVVQPGGDSVVQQAGYSTYTINWNADILVALPLKMGKSTTLVNATKSSSTWTVTVRHSNGTQDGNGFDVQEATEVFVFGAPIAGTTSMINLFDVNGNVVADLTRRPLTFRAILPYPPETSWTAMPSGITVPAVIGSLRDRFTNTTPSNALYVNNILSGIWRWNPNFNGMSVIERATTKTHRSVDDGGGANTSSVRDCVAVIIEANGL